VAKDLQDPLDNENAVRKAGGDVDDVSKEVGDGDPPQTALKTIKQ
jgi:hypothetical protein